MAPQINEPVCLISAENSRKARILRAQRSLHSAIGRVDEYCHPSVKAKNMCGKIWHKMSYTKLNLCVFDGSNEFCEKRESCRPVNCKVVWFLVSSLRQLQCFATRSRRIRNRPQLTSQPTVYLGYWTYLYSSSKKRRCRVSPIKKPQRFYG